jgi:hypothetical protein
MLGTDVNTGICSDGLRWNLLLEVALLFCLDVESASRWLSIDENFVVNKTEFSSTGVLGTVQVLDYYVYEMMRCGCIKYI